MNLGAKDVKRIVYEVDPAPLIGVQLIAPYSRGLSTCDISLLKIGNSLHQVSGKTPVRGHHWIRPWRRDYSSRQSLEFREDAYGPHVPDAVLRRIKLCQPNAYRCRQGACNASPWCAQCRRMLSGKPSTFADRSSCRCCLNLQAMQQSVWPLS